uniref:Guanine nucleotide-binding protein-like 1 n=1 Tax=Pararge aegeria TaxID=116150 RepID=S4PWQ4_9NEOP
MCAEGATKILEACKDIVNAEVDLSSWEKKIKEETDVEFDDEETEIGETILEKPDTTFYTHERYKNGILTIGCVGQPNVGKSSLMNAIMGKKVVSVSRTPGHTKHFQTIFLTPQVRLCDCPGLVFPSKVPRPIQILMGSYPIAQLREPYTTIRYLAERLNLPQLLRMDHPENDDTWSPRDICDGWAKKRGYLTAKAARLDTYRAANSILRMALDGRICLWLRPPGYTDQREVYETCDEIKYVKWVQAITKGDDMPSSSVPSSDTDERSGNGSSGDESADDGDDDDDDDDDDDRTEMANKFAALANDD